MNFRKTFLSALAIFIVFSMLAASVHAESNETPVNEANQLLKERRHFNKLKRSTRNIYKVTMRSGVTFKLQTALGYISTIDLPEKALKVFCGDQEQFRIEVFSNQVLVKPITDEPDARTNLVIITDSTRLAFDVTIGEPETADFVLDFRLPAEEEALVKNAFEEKLNEKTKELESAFKEKEEKLNEKAEKLSEELLKEKVVSGIKTIQLKNHASSGEVQVNLLSLSQVADKGYLRFSVLNYSKTPYKVLKASIGALNQENGVLKNKDAGFVEFESEAKIASIISPDKYEYGVIVFDFAVLRKNQKAIFKLFEDIEQTPSSKARDIEIKGFDWLK